MIIDVYADVVCPWCYIGERRLEQAIALRPNMSITRRWRPFQLQPTMPPRGLAWAEFARRKFGGVDDAQRIFAQVTAVGAADGLTFAFDKVVSAPNTIDAHRLVALGRQHGREWEMVDALFAAYFAAGRDLNDHAQLVEIATAVGLPADEVQAYLASTDGVAEVLASQAEAEQLGVSGVPFYVIDEQYAVSGAQPVAVLLQAIDAVSELQPITQSTITLNMD